MGDTWAMKKNLSYQQSLALAAGQAKLRAQQLQRREQKWEAEKSQPAAEPVRETSKERDARERAENLAWLERQPRLGQ